jgi:sugar phosphate isomerase/epimerase
VDKRQFGICTRLYQYQRLRREHLLDIAAHGFEWVEVLATRTHFDYHNAGAVADLQQWLAEAGLELSSVHAPVGAGAIEEVEQALFVARRIPVRVFVMPLEGTRDVARRNLDRLAKLAEPLGVTVAAEAAPAPAAPTRPGSLVHMVEEDVETAVGISLDFARSHTDGDLIDAIEVVAEHLISVRVPLDSAIDWPSAMTTLQKIGYEGPITFDMPPRGSTKDTLARARAAREKMERWLTSI